MDKKWYKSKTIWGVIASAIGSIALGIARFYNVDISEVLKIAGVILNAFGIQFAISGRIEVGRKLAGK